MEKRKRKTITGIIAGAAVLLLAGTVYFFYRYKRIGADQVISLREAYVFAAAVMLCAVLAVVVLLLIVCLQGGITRKASSDKLEVQYREKLFSLLTQNTDHIFILFSPDTFEADYISPNIERVIGINPDMARKDMKQIIGMLLNDGNTSPDEIMSSIPQGGFWQEERELLHRETGQRRWYREILYRIRMEDTQKCIMIISDCMKEHQMSETLKNALSSAEAANRAKSNFLSNMSHDIRTPMNAIVGFTILLGKDADNPEKVREYTQKITASSQHLLSLINDVLDMSKIESGKTTLNVSEFSLPLLLEKISTIILPQARARGQNYEMLVHDKIPETLMGDELRLNQIFINLLSNAVKYTQEGGSIWFHIRSLKQLVAGSVRLQFEVTDNGYGMSEEFIGKIFDPFAREANSTVSGIQGTGLGMPITKNIVELMGGTIQVKSEQGKGSTFIVEMELAVPEQDRDREFWSHHSITKALVVDDEEDICLMISRIMEETGIEIQYATSGFKALDMVKEAKRKEQEYNVILLDWKMPDMDGVETARRIRECVGGEVPILILTSYDWSEVEDEARRAGINGFMPKPFFLSTFRNTVKNVLERDRNVDSEAEERKDVLDGMLFLVAEDNELNAEILEKMLEMSGARCEIASNGQEAVDMFRQSAVGHYDMVLMDIQMPVMNGYDAARLIRSCRHTQAATIPVIAMTANAFAEDVQKALNSGMNEHVSKPVDMEVLRNVIKKYKSRDKK